MLKYLILPFLAVSLAAQNSPKVDTNHYRVSPTNIVVGVLSTQIQTNWHKVSTTYYDCAVMGCLVNHPPIENFQGYIQTNTVVKLKHKGKEQTLVLEYGQEFYLSGANTSSAQNFDIYPKIQLYNFGAVDTNGVTNIYVTTNQMFLSNPVWTMTITNK